ncbi:hypothetical protein IT402_01550 [Candidatus Nomurabacteria bacterium]|nr:hypothetical protein [Candidatus Nomurabacteria bacterium]
MFKHVPQRPKKFIIAFEKIKENFSIVSSSYIEHFTDLNGFIEKIIINFQGTKAAILLVESNNDVQLRLFDTDYPEDYYIKESWIPESRLRSNRPFILNWKCLYTNPKKESWCDLQLPLHKTSKEVKAVAFKLLEIVVKIEAELVASNK